MITITIVRKDFLAARPAESYLDQPKSQLVLFRGKSYIEQQYFSRRKTERPIDAAASQ